MCLFLNVRFVFFKIRSIPCFLKKVSKGLELSNIASIEEAAMVTIVNRSAEEGCKNSFRYLLVCAYRGALRSSLTYLAYSSVETKQINVQHFGKKIWEIPCTLPSFFKRSMSCSISLGPANCALPSGCITTQFIKYPTMAAVLLVFNKDAHPSSTPSIPT